jgi:protein FRA10AC1
VWNATADVKSMSEEQLFAYKYYQKLFKEYCLADLSAYKEKRLALRWRIQTEVFEGKGHFSCGNLRCTARTDLASWEVPFSYAEQGLSKTTLVKLRLCPPCSCKLNYTPKGKKRKGGANPNASKGRGLDVVNGGGGRGGDRGGSGEQGGKGEDASSSSSSSSSRHVKGEEKGEENGVEAKSHHRMSKVKDKDKDRDRDQAGDRNRDSDRGTNRDRNKQTR